MTWGNSVKTVYVTLSVQPQQIRPLMPVICKCGRYVIEWIFADYTNAMFARENAGQKEVIESNLIVVEMSIQ